MVLQINPNLQENCSIKKQLYTRDYVGVGGWVQLVQPLELKTSPENGLYVVGQFPGLYGLPMWRP